MVIIVSIRMRDFQQNIDHVINNTYGTGTVKIELSNASIGCMFEYTERTEVFYLHVDADVPTIHYNDHENIMIPVNVTDGDDVVWAITAIAITPDDEKLVKAIAIPTSTTSAEIKLEIQRAPKEKVTTYIEVTTLGVELTGEHYFHETMVEVNIEP